MCESNFICIFVFILVYICTHAVFIAPATDESEEFLNMSAPSPIGGGCLWQPVVCTSVWSVQIKL